MKRKQTAVALAMLVGLAQAGSAVAGASEIRGSGFVENKWDDVTVMQAAASGSAGGGLLGKLIGSVKASGGTGSTSVNAGIQAENGAKIDGDYGVKNDLKNVKFTGGDSNLGIRAR